MQLMVKTPELPVFRDNTDDIETYLERVERIANAYKWDKSNWAIMLSSLLSGKALDVYEDYRLVMQLTMRKSKEPYEKDTRDVFKH